MGPEEFRAATDVSRETLDRLESYAALLTKWSGAINLVGRETLRDAWRRHFLDSAQVVDHLPPAPAGRARHILDLGSGAGFPGLVLAILGAGEVTLVESDAKKAAFLREAARIAGAPAVVICARIESLSPSDLSPDAVTARALAPLPKLLDLAAPFLCPANRSANTGANTGANKEANKEANKNITCSLENGPVGLFLKGQEAERELTDSREKWKMQAEVMPSRSDPRGRIIRVSGLVRKETRP
jgi:16S rRNA (guanine527-N7)-methyltransferase